MKHKFLVRLLNTALRGVTMASRFVLILALAKLLDTSSLGEFGLFLASVAFFVMILGGDFHSYSLRELNSRASEEWSFILQHHMLAQLGLLVLIYPIIWGLLYFGYLHTSHVFWFLMIMLLELLCQEIHWLLIAMQKQISSSIVMFIRSGIWVYIVLPIMYFYPSLNNIESVLLAWSLGSFMAAIIGVLVIRESVPIWLFCAIDWKWIIKGFKVGGWFLLASLSIKGLFTFDRFFIGQLGSLNELGVYVFYLTLVMGAVNFLEPAVFSFLYPKMIGFYHNRDKASYLRVYRELAISTCIFTFILALLLFMIAPYIIQWVDKPIYMEYYDVFSVIIVIGGLYALGMIPHYGLYAMRKDKWIVGAQISSIILFVVMVPLLKLENSLMAVSISLMVSLFWMAMIKSIGYVLSIKSSFLKVGESI